MTTPEQVQLILDLRAKQVAPKQIARKLGLKPAEVTAIIQQSAEEQKQGLSVFDNLPPVHECWVNTSAFESLFRGAKSADEISSNGLSGVIVSRIDRNQIITCSFLVDLWCLGVKNAVPPKKMTLTQYDMFLKRFYIPFEDTPHPISLEQAQSIIWGSIDYARALSIEPHVDFARSEKQLGRRPDQLIELSFGKDGKPFFCPGPRDNPYKILDKLTAAVGPDGFHYLLPLGDPMFLP
jgi:hypothetical protein